MADQSYGKNIMQFYIIKDLICVTQAADIYPEIIESTYYTPIQYKIPNSN